MIENNNKYNIYKLGGAVLASLGLMYIILSIEGMEFWQICLIFGIIFAALGIKIYLGASKKDYNPNCRFDRLFWRFLINKEDLNLKRFPTKKKIIFMSANSKIA